MLRYFSDMFNQEMTRLSMNESSLSLHDREMIAKRRVCNTGVSKYKFEQRLEKLYRRSSDPKTTIATVEKGIAMGYLKLVDSHEDEEANSDRKKIVLTEDGFNYINNEVGKKMLTSMHTYYVAIGGKKV